MCMQNKPSKKAISFHHFLQKVKRFISLSEDYLEETTFYVFRTDTHQVLVRGLDGYEAAKSAANRIRSSLGLKWDQVAFKKEPIGGRSAAGGSRSRSRSTPVQYDRSSRYNPSKRGYFRGYYGADGSYHDID